MSDDECENTPPPSSTVVGKEKPNGDSGVRDIPPLIVKSKQIPAHSFGIKEQVEALPDPRKCEIAIGKPTTIEVDKEKIGLGLSIVGGVDTPLGAVIILEVYPDGAAALDGRLKPGDIVLQVDDVDLRNATHEKAISTLRQTPAVVSLTVLREEASADQSDLFEIMEIELHKKPGANYCRQSSLLT